MFAVAMYFVFFILVIRLAFIQMITRGKYIALAENQHRLVMKLEPERGKIFDRNGSPLAFNVPAVTVVAQADSIKDPFTVGHRLASIIRESPSEIIAKLRSGKGWVEVAHGLPVEVKEKIERADLDYVGCREDLQRCYPKSETGSQVVGFTRSDNAGGYGLELSWDNLLRGKPGMAIMQKTGRSRIFASPHHSIRKAVNGADLVLTIDSRYQRIAQQELEQTVAQYGAKSGSVVIMNPATGEVLAICSAPTFDANAWSNYSDSAWKLNAITDQYEPGSTFKLVSMAAMLDTGFKTENDRVFCENGTWNVLGHTINDTKKYGWLSVRDAIVFSSNIGMAKMGREFDKRKLYTYAESFGFGKPSRIELEGEISGLLKPVSDWSAFTPLVFSFGHEVAVTALQMACMFSTIANDGVYVSPRLILAVSKDGDYGRPDINREIHRVISAKTAVLLGDFMRDVVTRGTGTNAAVEGLSVCGKTGTAHVVRDGGMGYAENRYISSFGAFFPQEKPQLTIFVVINEPRGAYYGGSVAAPCFKRITERLISLEGLEYFVEPPREKKKDMAAQQKIMPNLVGLDKSDAARVVKRNGLNVKIEGDGSVVEEQTPVPGTVLPEDEKVHLFVGRTPETVESVEVPPLKNLPLRNALNLLAERQLNAKVSGNGQVVEQQPAAGKKLAPGTTVRLTCKAII
jgi:cell division protein FtsI (penicillin-binding protein 3)